MAVPRYVTIAADLRSQIEAGRLRPGTQLPPEQDLQDEYGKLFNLPGTVSRNTVRDAIEVLVREGLLEKRHGQGTFIVGKLDSFIREHIVRKYRGRCILGHSRIAFTMEIYTESPACTGRMRSALGEWVLPIRHSSARMQPA